MAKPYKTSRVWFYVHGNYYYTESAVESQNAPEPLWEFIYRWQLLITIEYNYSEKFVRYPNDFLIEHVHDIWNTFLNRFAVDYWKQ